MTFTVYWFSCTHQCNTQKYHAIPHSQILAILCKIHFISRKAHASKTVFHSVTQLHKSNRVYPVASLPIIGTATSAGWWKGGGGGNAANGENGRNMNRVPQSCDSNDRRRCCFEKKNVRHQLM